MKTLKIEVTVEAQYGKDIFIEQAIKDALTKIFKHELGTTYIQPDGQITVSLPDHEYQRHITTEVTWSTEDE